MKKKFLLLIPALLITTGELKMKKLLLLLISLCFGSMVLAQDIYEEEVRIFRPGELIAPLEDINAGDSTGPVLDACYAGLDALEEWVNISGIAPTVGARVKLYPVQFEETDATLLTENDDNSGGEQVCLPTGDVLICQKPVPETEPVEAIGEMLICQDWVTYFPAVIPVYYEITLGDMTYIAAGAGQSPNFPSLPVLPGGGQFLAPQTIGGEAGFPLAGIWLMSFQATIFPAAPVGEVPPFYPPNFGGTLTTNSVVDFLGAEDQFETDGVITIRTYTPVND